MPIDLIHHIIREFKSKYKGKPHFGLRFKNKDYMFKLMLLAGIGGFFGTCCRYLTNRLYITYFKTSLPLATFTVNILGCFILGLILGLMNKAGVVSPKINAFLVVGFCGGFTTFSTFSNESFSLIINGQPLTSVLYMAGSMIIGLIAVWLGIQLAN